MAKIRSIADRRAEFERKLARLKIEEDIQILQANKKALQSGAVESVSRDVLRKIINRKFT